MLNPDLSVCIPSFRRPERLEETLEAFLPQVQPHGIAICVSYNDDSAGTEDVLRRFKTRYPHVFWVTDTAVTGIDRNIVASVALARSRYVWLFGDDDIPEPAAIDRILNAVRAGEPAMVVVNGATYDSELARVIEPARLRIAADRLYASGENARFLSDTASYATFLGAVVVDRDLWSRIDPAPFCKSDYVHVAVGYRAVIGRAAKVIAEPLIRIRLGGATWAARYFQVELVNWPGVVWGLPSDAYPDESKNAVCGRKPTASFARLLATRAYGYFGPEQYRNFIHADGEIPAWRRLALRSILCVPVAAAELGLALYRRVQALTGTANLELTRYRLARRG